MTIETKLCHYCGEKIEKDAIKCRYCGECLLNQDTQSQINTTMIQSEKSGNEFIQQVVPTDNDNMSANPHQSSVPLLREQNLNTYQIILAIILTFIGFITFITFLEKFATAPVNTSGLTEWVLYGYIFGVFTILKKYITNFITSAPIRKYINLFFAEFVLLVVLFIANFLISSGVNMLNTPLEQLMKQDLIYVFFRMVLLFSIFITLFFIGHALIYKVKDYVGGLKSVGYLFCFFGAFLFSIICITITSLLSKSLSNSILNATLTITLIVAILIVGMLIRAINKAIHYKKQHGTRPSSDMESYKEPKIKRVGLALTIALILTASYIYTKTYQYKAYTNNVDWQKWLNEIDSNDNDY